MAVSKLSVVKYFLFGCLLVGLVGWNVHLQTWQTDVHEERSKLLRRIEVLETGVTDERTRLKRSVDNTSVPNGYSQGGALYIRWGRTVCPDSDSELVYDGIVGSAHHMESSGGAEYLCLTRDPQFHYLSTRKVEDSSKIYGVELELRFSNMLLFDRSNIAPSRLQNADMVCAVCCSKTKSTQVMIPGRRECYPGWKREYWGYLVTGAPGYKGWHSFACLDHALEAREGGSDDDEQGTMRLVQGMCGSLPCGNYVNGYELTCVVCTK